MAEMVYGPVASRSQIIALLDAPSCNTYSASLRVCVKDRYSLQECVLNYFAKQFAGGVSISHD